MKINREQLKEIILEEIENVLNEEDPFKGFDPNPFATTRRLARQKPPKLSKWHKMEPYGKGANMYDISFQYIALSKSGWASAQKAGKYRRALLVKYGGKGILQRLRQRVGISDADAAAERRVNKEMVKWQNSRAETLQGYKIKAGHWINQTYRAWKEGVRTKQFLINAHRSVGDILKNGYYQTSGQISGIRAKSPKEALNKVTNVFADLAQESGLSPPDNDIAKHVSYYSITDLKTKKTYKGKLT